MGPSQSHLLLQRVSYSGRGGEAELEKHSTRSEGATKLLSRFATILCEGRFRQDPLAQGGGTLTKSRLLRNQACVSSDTLCRLQSQPSTHHTSPGRKQTGNNERAKYVCIVCQFGQVLLDLWGLWKFLLSSLSLSLCVSDKTFEWL